MSIHSIWFHGEKRKLSFWLKKKKHFMFWSYALVCATTKSVVLRNGQNNITMSLDKIMEMFKMF